MACMNNTTSCCSKPTETASSHSATLESVVEYYSKTLKTSKDLKTSACTAAGRPTQPIRSILEKVPGEVLEKFYGCGAPLPLGIQGLRVLDLGSGSGRDCYVAAALVGEQGTVTGIDMTEEQLQVARKHAEEYTRQLGYAHSNMTFVKGHIEDLRSAGTPDESVDLVISNCVVNLSPDKRAVLREAYRVLAPGGEFHFSDVYSSLRLTEQAKKDKVLWGECIGGALYARDFEQMAREAGFAQPRALASAEIEVRDKAMAATVGPARFFSVTYRLFKLPGLTDASGSEDYGQAAIYKGTIEGSETVYVLDAQHSFVKGKPELVCGTTAAMLGYGGMSWLAPHFQVLGDRSTHYGAFTATCHERGLCCSGTQRTGHGTCRQTGASAC